MKYLFKISFFLLFISWNSSVQYSCALEDHAYRYRKGYRIMFWNVENLFDTFNDSLTEDDEFLPGGIRHWTYEKYSRKLIHIYKGIIAAGMDRPPEIIGLCEIENQRVLFDLINETPLRHFKYRFVHYESPDRRGIDVAILYNPEYVQIINQEAIPVDLSGKGGGKVRDILYVRAVFSSEDTISVYVNHWPSKYGGAGKTENFRMVAATILKMQIKNLMLKTPDEKIIIMGDFNDPPESNSVSVHLDCREPNGPITNNLLYNMSVSSSGISYGSYKYQGIWELLDQFIVNGDLLSGQKGLQTGNDKYKIFAPDFLLQHDEIYGGRKPFRTFNGMHYQGGFSDHLPVYLDLEIKGKP